MLNYRDTQNALHTRLVDFSLQEYLFVLQTILGEDPCVAYASVFDGQNFKRNVPSEDEEEYLAQFQKKAEALLETQDCVHLKEYLETEYQRDIQEQASTLKDFKFTGSDVQKILNNLLRDRTLDLSESSVKDITSILKMMYENGSLDSGDNFQRHWITIPSKYNTICPQCSREGYAVEGLDFRCKFCGCIAKWDESQRRYFPNLEHL
jgi:hypothetical protein